MALNIDDNSSIAISGKLGLDESFVMPLGLGCWLSRFTKGNKNLKGGFGCCPSRSPTLLGLWVPRDFVA